MELDGGRTVYAASALDALGIPPMLEADGAVLSRDPSDGSVIRVSVQGGRWSWDPPTAALLVAGTDGPGPRAHPCRPAIRLHRDPESAEVYLRGHTELRGRVLGPAEAIEAAARIFGDLLAPCCR